MNREEILKSLEKWNKTLYDYLKKIEKTNNELFESTMSNLERQCFENEMELIEYIWE